MKKYRIQIKETLRKVVEVEAESAEEAMQIADNNYRKADADYVLSAENFENVDIGILADD